MSDPSELRPALTDLLQATEKQDADAASCQVKKIITDLEASSAGPDPLGREYRPATARFSGLYHALLRELRRAEGHITGGNWTGALKCVRETLLLLPEPQVFHKPRPLPN